MTPTTTTFPELTSEAKVIGSAHEKEVAQNLEVWAFCKRPAVEAWDVGSAPSEGARVIPTANRPRTNMTENRFCKLNVLQFWVEGVGI